MDLNQGTGAAASQMITLSIDGRSLQVEKGRTVLQAARQHAIDIPTLCDHPTLRADGKCRMCLVEVEGRPQTPTACTLEAQEGMVVRTQTPKVQALRSEVLQLLLSEHPSCCLFCPYNGACEECMVTLRKVGITTGCHSCPKDGQCALQDLVTKLGVQGVPFPIHYRMLKVEKSDPFLDCDYNLCVLCGRCVRVCEQLHFSPALAYTQRGSETLVGTAFGRTRLETGCAFCGACVEVCPTGALSEKTRKWDGKPEQEVLSTCPLCSLGCSLRLLVKKGQVIGSLPAQPSVLAAPAAPAAPAGNLCVKGRFGITELVNHPSRLKQPARTLSGRQVALEWEEALRLAVEKLAACPPGQFELVLSANCTNEELYLAQKFARQVMKSERVRTRLPEIYGDGFQAVRRLAWQGQAGSSPLETRIEQADLLVCLGVDGRYAQSVVEVAIHRAHLRGARLISVYPVPHGLEPQADAWLQPWPGEEIELVHALSGLPQPDAQTPPPPLQEAIRLLQEATRPLILVGPAFLAHPDNRRLLEAVEQLGNAWRAGVLALPAEGNLSGALRLGLDAGASAEAEGPVEGSPAGGVRYYLGEMPPASQPEGTFVIYQNIYPPAAGCPVDLILPAAAFSEQAGTTTDHTGLTRAFRQAVDPPGQALPGWQILCKLAQALGAEGFDYRSAEEIQPEMVQYLQDVRESACALALMQDAASSALPASQSREHFYLGLPLSTWVAGLRQLYPAETPPAMVKQEKGN